MGVFGTMRSMQLSFLLLKIALLLLGAVFLLDGALWVTTALMGVLMVGLVVFAVEAGVMWCRAVGFLASSHKNALR